MTGQKIAYATGGETRLLGAKGLQTRRRIVEATTDLLAVTRLRDLTVAQIARRAEMSTASFYVYFKDVTDVVLAAVEELSQGTPGVLALLSADWTAASSPQLAKELVTQYVRFWQDHCVLFRIRNLAAEEGDDRFSQARHKAVKPVQEKIERIVVMRQAEGRLPLHLKPTSFSGSLLALLERIAAVSCTIVHGDSPLNVAIYGGSEGLTDLIDSTAHIIASMLSDNPVEYSIDT